MLVLLLVPVYRARNVRWTALADLSTQVLATLQDASARHPEGGRVVLIESPAERFNLDATFGAMFAEAVALHLGPRWHGEVAAPGYTPAASTLRYRLSNGRLRPVE